MSGFLKEKKQQFLRLAGQRANVSEMDLLERQAPAPVAEAQTLNILGSIHPPYLGENRETYKGSFQLEYGILRRHTEGRERRSNAHWVVMSLRRKCGKWGCWKCRMEDHNSLFFLAWVCVLMTSPVSILNQLLWHFVQNKYTEDQLIFQKAKKQKLPWFQWQ